MQFKEWIKQSNKSQIQVANALGIEETRLCRILSGKLSPTLYEVCQIEALTKRKVKMEDFLTQAKGKQYEHRN